MTLRALNVRANGEGLVLTVPQSDIERCSSSNETFRQRKEPTPKRGTAPRFLGHHREVTSLASYLRGDARTMTTHYLASPPSPYPELRERTSTDEEYINGPMQCQRGRVATQAEE